MARAEHDREDLLAEATALVERLELEIPHAPHPVVLGVRRDGCLSIYFSPDEAWHFNTRHELRRAYSEGQLFKAERGRLVAMTRQRAAGVVHLVRRELTAAEQTERLARAAAAVERLAEQITQGTARVVRCVPAELPALNRAAAWLAALPPPWRVAPTPHAR